MQIPQNQQELIRILLEQEKQIKSLRKALNLLETRINHVTRVADRARGENRKLNEQIQVLKHNVK